MKTRCATWLTSLMFLSSLLGLFPKYLAAQTTNVTTGHQDIPAICTDCVYRTGQNLQESTITYHSLSKSTLGQFCNYTSLDGQVYAQPLVVTNVNWNQGGTNKTVVYVVTMNSSVYAFDGTPSAPSTYPAPSCTKLAGPVSLLHSGEIAPTCNKIGAGGCMTIAPNVGILGAPVISTQTEQDNSTGGTLYAVAEAQSGTSYYHRLWALDITTLSLSTATQETISPTNTSGGNCSGKNNDTTFSLKHIQRPALLFGTDTNANNATYLYIAFSMMDGDQLPYPYGVVFAYNTASLGTAPLCLLLAQDTNNATDGAGVWGGGGGPVYAQDTDTQNSWRVFFNTGNGGYDHVNNWGDSFLKVSAASAGSSPLSVVDWYTPGDQYWRSNTGTNCSNGDIDFGSGSPMLIPDGENTDHQHLAVSGDKEGGLWFMNWPSPGGYHGTGDCMSGIGSDGNVQIFKISSNFRNGPLIHHTPAFWESCCSSPNADYLFVGTSSQAAGTGSLLRYQICGSGSPISATAPCTQTGVSAQDSSGHVIEFQWGATPSISAASTTDTDAIVWAIWTDNYVLPSTSQFTWHTGGSPATETFPAAKPGILYAFDAAGSTTGMPQLYSSEDCVIGGSYVDRINPATKNSIPTVANSYVYVGTMGPFLDPTSSSCNSNASSACWNVGSFYIFGHFDQTHQRTTCS
jgi:hypothetical protein